MQKCKKHNINLKCIGGRNAHSSNWYCLECDKENHIKKKIKERSEIMKSHENWKYYD